MARKVREEVSTGLALGGLAGNNAHGAGVLQAALDYGLQLDMISCTSGQIHWVNLYLEALKARKAEQQPREERVLRRALEKDINSLGSTKIAPLDDWWLALVGKPQVFRFASWEFPLNVARNMSAVLGKMVASAQRQPMFSSYRELADVWPAQSLVPLFPDSFFDEISENFNFSDREKKTPQDIGIVFNSYDVRSGEENVYLNERARDLLKVDYEEQNRYREGTTYRPISPQAVRQGLWLYEYGEPRDTSAIDGAYYRQVMLSELSRAHTIYVARPINTRWLGSFPSSWISLQDLKTEVNFNGTYIGERDKIALMNKLLAEEAIDAEKVERKGYHQIKLVEFEIQTQRGYFDYVHEDVDVFDRAYEKALSAFTGRRNWPEGALTETKGTEAA